MDRSAKRLRFEQLESRRVLSGIQGPSGGLELSLHGQSAHFMQRGLERVTRTSSVELSILGDAGSTPGLDRVQFIHNGAQLGGPIPYAPLMPVTLNPDPGWGTLEAELMDSGGQVLQTLSTEVFFADLGAGSEVFADGFEHANGLGDYRFWDNMPGNISPAAPWRGFTDVSLSAANRNEGSFSLHHEFAFPSSGAPDSALLSYIGANAMGDGVRGADAVLLRAMPYSKLDIYVQDLSGAALSIRPGSGSEEYLIDAPTGGWITLDLASLFVEGSQQDRHGAEFDIVVVPADGLTDLSGASGRFWIDDFRVTADSRNAVWIAELEESASSETRSREDEEASIFIDAQGVVGGDVTLRVAPGEPEAFSARFDSQLSLVQAIPSVTDFVNDSGVVVPATAMDVKWLSNWNQFRFNDPSRAGQNQYDTDTSFLRALDLPSQHTEAVWVSLRTPGDAAPGLYAGEFILNHESGAIRADVTIEVLEFELSSSPVVETGIYALEPYKDVPAALDWMALAGMTKSTYAQPTSIRRYTPSLQPFLHMRGLVDEVAARQANGVDPSELHLTGILEYDLNEYLFGSDRGNLGNWIGESVTAKLQLGQQELPSSSTKWLYSYDEAQGENLLMQAPIWETGKQLGYEWFAAIHLDYYFEIIDPSVSAPGAEAWSHYSASFGDTVGQYISHWITTERSPAFSALLNSEGQVASSYGYPFTDIDGYAVHRGEFWRAMYAGNDAFVNYALDDIRGDLLGDGRKMGLLINTPAGLIEGASSDGYLRGHWDMRYLATLDDLVQQAVGQGLSGDVVTRAAAYVASPTTTAGWSNAKRDVIGHIRALNGLLNGHPTVLTVGDDGVNGGFDNRSELGEIALEFSMPVTAAAPSVALTVVNIQTGEEANLDNVVMQGNGTTRLVWDFNNNPLSDGRYRITLHASAVTGSGGNALAGDHVFSSHALRGDVDGDASVGPSDVSTLVATFGTTLEAWQGGDANGDGTVGPEDVSIVVSSFGNQL